MEGKKIVVGLTGNIASGKSTVGSILSEHSFPIIEADRIGWELLKNPSIAEKVVSTFGKVQKDGEIDRKMLGDMVFSDRAKLKALNDIVHPPLLKELKQQIQQSKADITVVNAALIIEWGIEDWFDRIILVICNEEKKIERLAKKGITREQAFQRLQSQLSESDKIPKSDFVIENNGTLEELREKTLKIIDQLKRIV